MRPNLAQALSSAFLAGEWQRADLVARGRIVLERRPLWLLALVRDVLAIYRDPPADRPSELAEVLRSLPASRRAGRTRPRARPIAPTRMVRNPFGLPRLDGITDLAALLELEVPALLWLADTRGLERSAGDQAIRHYRVSHRLTPSGGIRVLEAPKPRLKHLQRRLIAELLHLIPPHEAAHGFRPGRSVGSYAAPHAGKHVVLRLDLEAFFASVGAARTYGVLRSAGYPEPVAYSLTGLATTSLSRAAWSAVPRPADGSRLEAHWRLGRRLALPHLPQGAPTSPVLANLAAYRLDVRLSALARSWGGHYTRYADDLALSGGRSWGRRSSRLLDAIGDVVAEEGFCLNHRKTAVLPSGGRQLLGGLVVNERPHVGRREVDALRALLHNCVVHGPASQDRVGQVDWRAHLEGRVGWVAQHDPGRGRRLAALLSRIDWTG